LQPHKKYARSASILFPAFNKHQLRFSFNYSEKYARGASILFPALVYLQRFYSFTLRRKSLYIRHAAPHDKDNDYQYQIQYKYKRAGGSKEPREILTWRQLIQLKGIGSNAEGGIGAAVREIPEKLGHQTRLQTRTDVTWVSGFVTVNPLTQKQYPSHHPPDPTQNHNEYPDSRTYPITPKGEKHLIRH
jgi:hypothetical protein